MALNPSRSSINIASRFQDAVQYYWNTRRKQKRKQQQAAKIKDAGARSAVTGGGQMAKLELLVSEILCDAGLDRLTIHRRVSLELPGYFRPEKKWDLIAVADSQLILAMEFKSQAGPSFGNNFNNRTEEAVGSATDIWTVYREGRLGKSEGFKPLLGYFFLLEDCKKVHAPISPEEPHFEIDPIFKNASYSKRYEILCRRLVMERLYDVACLTLSSNERNSKVTHPSADLSFELFVTSVKAQAEKWLAMSKATKKVQ